MPMYQVQLIHTGLFLSSFSSHFFVVCLFVFELNGLIDMRGHSWTVL